MGYNIVGISTSGEDAIKKCEWVGVSIDAGTKETFAKIKGVSESAFTKVLDNISKVSNTVDITYKYLVHPDNCHEVYEAISLAEQIGCTTFHSRPGGDAWFNLDKGEFKFNKDSIDTYSTQMDMGRKDFETDCFKIFGIIHKFTDNWDIKHSFEKCYATSTNCYINPKGVVGLCCDRRGDKSLELCHITEAKEMWGSQKHWDMIKQIKLNECPRCTYTHVNEMFDNVLFNDSMLYNFI